VYDNPIGQYRWYCIVAVDEDIGAQQGGCIPGVDYLYAAVTISLSHSESLRMLNNNVSLFDCSVL
jgi:hypothetical protein